MLDPALSQARVPSPSGRMGSGRSSGRMLTTWALTRIINSLKKSVERPRLMHYALGRDVLKLDDGIRQED